MRPVAIVLAALVLSPTAALAQSTVPDSVAPAPAYKPVTEIDLEGADVHGRRDGPTVILDQQRTPADRTSFIVLRANFNPEMDQSATQVR